MPRRSRTTNQAQSRSRVAVQEQNLPLVEEEQTVVHGNNAASFPGLPEACEDLIVKKVAKKIAKKIAVPLVLLLSLVLCYCIIFWRGERKKHCYQLQFQIAGWSFRLNAQRC